MTTHEVLKTIPREEGIAFFNAKKTDKEVYDILVSKGLTDSFETFTSEAKKFFIEKISTMSKEEVLTQIDGAELTDDQLSLIAGGNKTTAELNEDIANGVAIGGSVILVAIAASAF